MDRRSSRCFFGWGWLPSISGTAALKRTLPLQVVQQLLDFMKNGVWGVVDLCRSSTPCAR
ncbi:MAG: hypothetical protein MZV64_15395 [Ignavibacteriales bacterium]|nr:hypothetical protein [Ignavibacteriales bacterium]